MGRVYTVGETTNCRTCCMRHSGYRPVSSLKLIHDGEPYESWRNAPGHGLLRCTIVLSHGISYAAPPMRTAVTTQAHADLVQRVRDLSMDTEPEVFPPLDPGENLETTMRRRAEESFQDALCRRTWWRLTPDERSAIRATILAKDPYYRTHPESHGFEITCCDAIRRMLREDSPLAGSCC